jgi:hypothetical protein
LRAASNRPSASSRAQLLEGELERALPARLELADPELEVAARAVHRRLAEGQHLEPVGGIEGEAPGVAAEEDGAQLRLVVLEREVQVAGGGAAEVRDLAHHPGRARRRPRAAPAARRPAPPPAGGGAAPVIGRRAAGRGARLGRTARAAARRGAAGALAIDGSLAPSRRAAGARSRSK